MYSVCTVAVIIKVSFCPSAKIWLLVWFSSGFKSEVVDRQTCNLTSSFNRSLCFKSFAKPEIIYRGIGNRSRVPYSSAGKLMLASVSHTLVRGLKGDLFSKKRYKWSLFALVGRSPTFAYWRKVGYQAYTWICTHLIVLWVINT